jgi:hypothetical protein
MQQFHARYTQAIADMTRGLTAFRRRNYRLRFLIPPKLLDIAKRIQHRSGLEARYATVAHQSAYSNVYHCCVQKSGSQWVKSLLTDPMTFQYSGLAHYQHQNQRLLHDGITPRVVPEKLVTEAFPVNTIVSPMYISYPVYKSIPKSGPHKAIFVMRDPRDIIVSWYYSTMYSHLLVGNMARKREYLSSVPKQQGLLYAIDHMEKAGRFYRLLSWVDGAKQDPSVVLVRYEDLSASGPEALKRLFQELDIRMPEEQLVELLDAFSFKRLSGRSMGKENIKSHLRKGGSGDWRNHFDEIIQAKFDEVAGDLINRLGYE